MSSLISYSLKILFLFLIMEKSCAHECGPHGGQKRVSNSQELELQATVGQLWEPETELRFCKSKLYS